MRCIAIRIDCIGINGINVLAKALYKLIKYNDGKNKNKS